MFARRFWTFGSIAIAAACFLCGDGFAFGLVKAESAGSRIDAFFRAFLGLAVSSALVAAASLSAYDSDLDVGRNLDRSRSSPVKELMRLLMQIRLI